MNSLSLSLSLSISLNVMNKMRLPLQKTDEFKSGDALGRRGEGWSWWWHGVKSITQDSTSAVGFFLPPGKFAS